MLNFFNIPIPLLTIGNLSFNCSLKLSFPSSFIPKCFWVFTFSSTRLLKYKSGCFEECDCLEKITSWAYLVGSGLKTIFHCSVHSRIFLKSLFSTLFRLVSKRWQISENKEISSANSFTLLFKLSFGSLINTWKSKGPNIEPCGTPARIVSQSHLWPLSKTFWNLPLKKLLINWNKIRLIPYCFDSNYNYPAKFYQTL